MQNPLIPIAVVFLFLTSCVVKSPKYTSLTQVMTLEVGMKRAEVEKILQLKPYDVQSKSDTGNVMIYVYRLDDRRTLSFHTKASNGRATQGKYKPLAVTYSKDSVVLGMESCTLCQDNLTSMTKLDFEKIIMFLTVTVPVLLIYLGLKSK